MASQDSRFSMPIKPAYCAHIKESRSENPIDLIFEYFDDASYSDSSYCCMELRPGKKGGWILLLSSDKGPQSMDVLTHLLQWRISGGSDEIGHKGGGNKRLFYGHESTRVSILSVLGPDEFIRAETNPDRIFALSEDPELSEGDFQNKVDKECIKWPTDILSLEEDGGWFNSYRNEMESTGLPINYVIRWELTSLKDAYSNEGEWKHLIDCVRMKNYSIPIYFKNALVNETEFTTYENIDMIGLSHQEYLHTVQLYLDGIEYVIGKDGGYTNIKGDVIEYNSKWVLVGDIQVYRINEKYLQDSLRELNQRQKVVAYTQETFYGVYISLNGKQTNYCSMRDELLPLSKSMADMGNSLLRVVFIPSCENIHLEKIIKTDTVKSKTSFKNKPLVFKLLAQIRKGLRPDESHVREMPGPDKPPKPLAKKKTEVRPKGQVYIVRIWGALWKYGMITDEDNMKKRMNGIATDSIGVVKEFLGESITKKVCTQVFQSIPLEDPKAEEEWIGQLLSKDTTGNIKVFQHNGRPAEQREYFTCSDPMYMVNVILPEILRHQVLKVL